jgi:hypothetical protein
VEGFIAPAFISEFVFRSPQVLDRGREREVADLLITRGDQALLISQKCQEEPNTRTPEKTTVWARKQAAAATSQLKGALRRVGREGEIWCNHPRRGRVPFPAGLPPITHAIATIEVFARTELDDDLPLEAEGTPITYVSVSDFLNLSQQLRTVPEIVRYLDARRSLCEAELRVIGAEQTLFLYYLLLDGSFANFTSLADAEQTLTERGDELQATIIAKAKRDRFSLLMEHVADQLAERHSQYRDGLSATTLDNYEPAGERRAYLQMQEIVAGMHLAERAELGRVFHGAVDKRKREGGSGLSFAAAQVSSQPDLVFILGSFGESPAFSRDKLLSAFHPLANEAMAHYDRSRCLIIIDRDGASYEVGLAVLTSPFTSEIKEHQSKVFGPLKTFAQNLHFRSA